jgi:hypothetical protein
LLIVGSNVNDDGQRVDCKKHSAISLMKYHRKYKHSIVFARRFGEGHSSYCHRLPGRKPAAAQ